MRDPRGRGADVTEGTKGRGAGSGVGWLRISPHGSSSAMSSGHETRAPSSSRARRQIDDVQRLARAIRGAGSYLRSLALDIRRRQRAGLPAVGRVDGVVRDRDDGSRLRGDGAGSSGDARARFHDRDYLLSAGKRNDVLALWEVLRYGLDSFGDRDYVAIYGLKPADWYARGVRLLARTAVECTRDALADRIGRDISALAATAPAVSGSVVVDPFAGSANTLYWIARTWERDGPSASSATRRCST